MRRTGSVVPAALVICCAASAPVVSAQSSPTPVAGGSAGVAGPIRVEVVKRDGRFELLRGGQVYRIKGAGLEFGSIEALAANGGNSFRTWRTDNGVATGGEVLDEAHRHGLTVLMCIEIEPERHGFDYDDEDAVAAQLAYARGEVLKYKDHPALLAWIIGNEPNLHFKNPKVFDAINDISKTIHSIDPNHPTTTALAGFDAKLAEHIRRRAPDLDFLSIQLYGAILDLPRRIEELAFDGPLLVTEWGSIGHWEVGKTSWGAPIEQTSSEKAHSYLNAHRLAIATIPAQIMGSYVFLWGQKQERTPTWYGMFLADGAATEVVDVMHYIWNGAWPGQPSPSIGPISLDSKTADQSVTLTPTKPYRATVAATDANGDALRYRWKLLRESEATQTGGDREEVPEELPGLIDDTVPDKVVVTAPDGPGAYRLFVYVHDDHGKAAHANIPFLVR